MKKKNFAKILVCMTVVTMLLTVFVVGASAETTADYIAVSDASLISDGNYVHTMTHAEFLATERLVITNATGYPIHTVNMDVVCENSSGESKTFTFEYNLSEEFSDEEIMVIDKRTGRFYLNLFEVFEEKIYQAGYVQYSDPSVFSLSADGDSIYTYDIGQINTLFANYDKYLSAWVYSINTAATDKFYETDLWSVGLRKSTWEIKPDTDFCVRLEKDGKLLIESCNMDASLLLNENSILASDPLSLTVAMIVYEGDTVWYKQYYDAPSDYAAWLAEVNSYGVNTCDHNYIYVSQDDTFHTTICTICKQNSGYTWNHILTETVLSAPTYNTTGETQYYCSICSYTKVVTTTMENHTCVNEWKSVDDTTHQLACTICQKVSSTGTHTWNSGVVTKQPTESTAGEKTFTCTVCSATKIETFQNTDFDTFLASLTNAEAQELFKKLFFYGADEDYGKWQVMFMEDTEVGYWFAKYFATEIFPDIANNGVSSKYYDDFRWVYYEILENNPEGSTDYQQGYQDAIDAVVNENPVQGLFQAMWSGCVLFVSTIANGVSIGGITLMNILVTLLIIVIVGFVVKIIGAFKS